MSEPVPASEPIGAKAWVGAGVRMALFPLAFLWPAGTWQWWEAWVLVAMWLGWGVLMTVWLARNDPALLAARMDARPAQEDQEGWDKLWMLATFPVGIALFVVPGLDVVRFGWSEPFPVWVEVLALALHVPCFLLLARVMRENPYLFRVVKVDEEHGHEVVTTGPYAVVRHPMYVAVIVLVLALPVALGSRFGLVPGGLLAAMILARTVMEDRTLHEELPGYVAFAERTRYRLLPGVW